MFVNTGDRPIQIGSHIHLPDVNAHWSSTGRSPTGSASTSPPARRSASSPVHRGELDAVALRGARRVPGIQIKTDGQELLDGVA